MNNDTPESVHREIESDQRTAYGVRPKRVPKPIIGALWVCSACAHKWNRVCMYKEACPECGSYSNRRAKEDK